VAVGSADHVEEVVHVPPGYLPGITNQTTPHSAEALAWVVLGAPRFLTTPRRALVQAQLLGRHLRHRHPASTRTAQYPGQPAINARVAVYRMAATSPPYARPEIV
jgi:hypothetical protein